MNVLFKMVKICGAKQGALGKYALECFAPNYFMACFMMPGSKGLLTLASFYACVPPAVLTLTG